VSPQITNIRSLDSTSKSTTYALSVNQPLLAGAWGNASLSYATKVARLDHEQFTVQQRKDLASTLSDIRNRYWNYYEKQKLLDISASALAYAQQQADRTRARFRVGEVAALDTLSAVLELLSAKESHLDNQVGVTISRDDLARALAMASADSLVLPDSVALSVPDLPPPEEFLRSVETYDPQLRIFDVMRKKLEIQYGQNRNALLPSLAAQANYSYNTDDANASIKNNSVMSLIFSYSLPLVDKKITMAQTRLSQKRNSLSEEDYRIQLTNSITEMERKWQQEREKLALSKMAKDVAVQYLAAAGVGYELGTVNRLDVLKAQNDVVTKSVSYLQQQISFKRLEIVFDEITGNVFKRFGVELQ
jgi:outer membrane protein TolC